jgi:hypothetical protein
MKAMKLVPLFLTAALLSSVALAKASSSGSAALEVFVSESGGTASFQGRTIKTVKFQDALSKAGPGTRIQLLPGTYTGTYSLNRSGQSGQPIVISGTKDAGSGKPLSIFEGQQAKAYEGTPCLLFKGVEWVTVESMQVRGCWPHFIRANDSSYVTFRNSEISDSRIVFFAKGDKSHHFLIEGNRWIQDPSRAIWQDLPWEELHHGKYAYFNGALFGSKDILGDVIFRNNEISHAYNGIRMVADPAQVGKRNVNVQIYGNLFQNVRDNPIEPEGTATNWWIRHNRIKNGYAWFSFTTLDARDIYVFGNMGGFDDRPCAKDKRLGHCRGKVFKFEAAEPYPSGPFHVFHNSWYTPSPLIADGKSRNFHHWNNAIQFSDSDLTHFSDADWDASYEFDHDLSNLPFDELLKKNGQEKNGIVADPKFKDPRIGNFELTADSPAIDRAKKLDLAGWKSTYSGKAPDIGAYEGGRLFEGPNFRRVGNAVTEDSSWGN